MRKPDIVFEGFGFDWDTDRKCWQSLSLASISIYPPRDGLRGWRIKRPGGSYTTLMAPCGMARERMLRACLILATELIRKAN